MTMCVAPVAPGVSQTATDALENLRLSVSKATAIRHLQKRIQQGVALRRRRVRYSEDLEQARAEKATWVRAYTEMLQQMFHGEAGNALADKCNNGVGRVYPEYADTELFIEQFYDDMDYRLTCLRNITRMVSEMAEPVLTPGGSTKVALVERAEPAPAPSATPAAAPATSPAATVVAAPAPSPAPAPAPEKTEEADVVVDTEARTAVSGLVVTHGAAQPTLETVQRFLRELEMDILVLPAVPPEGTSAVAALERQPSASFAVVLLGSEDAANAVTFQLGYLVGRLGLSRVCALYERGAENRPNLHGIHCFPIDAGGGWHLALARHFKRSGIEIDLNKLC
jgi:hypothetical protein